MISPGSIPLNRNIRCEQNAEAFLNGVGWDVVLHVTEEAVYTDSGKRLCLVINTVIQSGTTEIPPL